MNKLPYIVALLLAGCGSDTGAQEETAKGTSFQIADMGDKWPFQTITEAEVLCLDGQYVVMRTDAGMYALNGTASQAAAEKGWKKLDGEQIVGKDISPLLNAGLKLCH